jgi:hypothetical protein
MAIIVEFDPICLRGKYWEVIKLDPWNTRNWEVIEQGLQLRGSMWEREMK